MVVHVDDVIGRRPAVITAGLIKQRCARAGRKPRIIGINKDAVGIIWIHRHTLIVPVLRIVAWVAGGVSAHAVPERAALRTGHEIPSIAAIGTRPDAYLAAIGITAAGVV